MADVKPDDYYPNMGHFARKWAETRDPTTYAMQGSSVFDQTPQDEGPR